MSMKGTANKSHIVITSADIGLSIIGHGLGVKPRAQITINSSQPFEVKGELFNGVQVDASAPMLRRWIADLTRILSEYEKGLAAFEPRHLDVDIDRDFPGALPVVEGN